MKKNKKASLSVEKIIGIAGLSMVIIGCGANIYNALVNQRFIDDPIDIFYYLRYFILLGIGFLIGASVSGLQKKKEKHHPLFIGTIFALIAMSAYLLLDLIRFLLLPHLGMPPYPWARIIFEGLSVAALIVTTIVALMMKYSSRTFAFAQRIFVGSFLATQVYMLCDLLYHQISHTGQQTANLWLVIVGFLIHPLVITLITYLLLSKSKTKWERLLYACCVGAIIGFFIVLSWEFQTSPYIGDVEAYSIASSGVSLVLAVVLINRIRAVLK